MRDVIHEIDYAIWLYGAPTEVFCRTANTGRLGIESEESADILWTAPTGAIISIRLDYLTRAARRRMTAFGESGDIEWDAMTESVGVRLVDCQTTVDHVAQPRDAMMQAQAEALLAAVGGDDAGPLATFADGAVAIAVCDAARRSSQSGRVEAVEDWAAA